MVHIKTFSVLSSITLGYWQTRELQEQPALLNPPAFSPSRSLFLKTNRQQPRIKNLTNIHSTANSPKLFISRQI